MECSSWESWDLNLAGWGGIEDLLRVVLRTEGCLQSVTQHCVIPVPFLSV